MKIQLKRSNVLDGGAAKEPTASQMEWGELAVNYNSGDPAIFIKDNKNNIIRIAGSGSIGSGETPSGGVLPLPGDVLVGDVFFNTTDNTFYYWNGSSWVAVNGQDYYVNISGDNMDGNLTLGGDKIILNAETGQGTFTGKITTAATIGSDSPTTVATKGYVDSAIPTIPSVGDGALTIKTSGEGATSTGTFTANQSGPSELTLPAIRYIDITGSPAPPMPPGAGYLNIETSTGTLLGSFNANASTGTTTTITLPSEVAPTAPGDGVIKIIQGGVTKGEFNVNQDPDQEIELDSPGDGTITISQNGRADQTFKVNQSGNTVITLDGSGETPGNGALKVRNYNDNTNASGSFTANQSGDSTLQLPQIKWENIGGAPVIPSPQVQSDWAITQSSDIRYIKNKPNIPTEVIPGSGALQIKNYNDSQIATGSFNANNASVGTLTLRQIKYADISGTPPGPGEGTLNIKDATGQSLGTFNANATTGTETVITLPASVVPTPPGDGILTIKNFGDSSSAENTFTANQGGNTIITLKQIKYADVSGTPNLATVATTGSYNDLSDKPTIPPSSVNLSTVYVGTSIVSITNDRGSDAAINSADGSTAGVMSVDLYNKLQEAHTNKNTNLSNTTTVSTVTIESSTGNNTSIAAADGSTAGVMSVDLYNKLQEAHTNKNTNLSNTTTVSTVTIESSTGNNTSIAAADGTQAGVMTSDQHQKLETAYTNSISAWGSTLATGNQEAWVNLTCSLNRTGVYDYQFNPSSLMSNNFYAVVVTPSNVGDSSDAYYASVQNKTTTGFQVKTWFRNDTPGGGPVSSNFSNFNHSVIVIGIK